LSESKRDRDRATEAFRRWARAGCPGTDQIRDGKGAEDLRACVAVFASLEEKRADRYRTNFPAIEIMEAVRAVYMEYPRRKLRRGEIALRVIRFGREEFADERTVYRWLSTARRMWADFRDKTCQ
jgi:hypothetical protein